MTAAKGTTIPATSLSRVLEGAAVATKAPDVYIKPISTWLQQYKAVNGNDSPLDRKFEDGKSCATGELPFDDWCTSIESQPAFSEKGVRQLCQVVLAIALLRERSRRGLELDSSTLDTIWDLVYDAIIGAQGTELQFTVSRSAQGFLAVPLCSLLANGKIEELWRFHTWMPDGQRGIDEKVCIHAHQPFGQSWTLLGSGTDCTFHVDTPDDDALTTHAAYECCYASADGKQSGSGYQTHQMSSTIRSSGRLLRVATGDTFPHSRDMTYSVPGGAYHRSIVSGEKLHATLFVFDSHRGYDDDAAVLGPKDGGEYVQLRDPAGITPVALAQMANATRKWEQAHNIFSEGDSEHPTVMAYYRFFRGMGLLEAGRRHDALQYFNPGNGFTPLHAFAREPSSKHRDYISQLIEAGAVLTAADSTGSTALDYARQSGDTEAEALILAAMKRSPHNC